MNRALMIFEIPGKQRYIFSSKALKDNVERSVDIAYLMNEYEGQDFFRDIAEEKYPDNPTHFYSRKRNLVYAGGGHTILQFEGSTREAAREQAETFGQVVTWEAMRRFHGVELFTKIIDCDDSVPPGENILRLHRELEQKKARRQAAFRRTTLGMERLGAEIPEAERTGRRRDLSFRPVPKVRPSDGVPPKRKEERFPFAIRPPEGFAFPLEFQDLADASGFIAVVHIDGNGMGNRSAALNLRQDAQDWETFRTLRQRFTEGAKESYRAALVHTMDMAGSVAEKPVLPMRPVILAGDDVCFVTAGNLGLECARVFLEFLANGVTNLVDGREFPGYPACAGVVLVHQNYPFHRAYRLAEELCTSAKQYGACLDEQGRVSAMDWHIEFGQLKDDLEDQRRDYITEDGNCLQLRPVTVCVPKNLAQDARLKLRSYDYFRIMCRQMLEEKTARGKIKGLRNALKQGEIETQFYLRMNCAVDLLDHSIQSLYGIQDEKEQRELLRKIRDEKIPSSLPAFADTDGEGRKRSLLFDSIEMVDHCRFFEEG